ncbi:binding partner of ACD11 1-like protein, partial [Tanacetum coccineum]
RGVTPYHEEAENKTLVESHERLKFENDDFICRGHILNAMPDPLFDVYQIYLTDRELWNALEERYFMEDETKADWLRDLLINIPLWPKPMPPIFVLCDSQSTLSRAYNGGKGFEGFVIKLGIACKRPFLNPLWCCAQQVQVMAFEYFGGKLMVGSNYTKDASLTESQSKGSCYMKRANDVMRSEPTLWDNLENASMACRTWNGKDIPTVVDEFGLLVQPTRTVKVGHLSDLATEREIHEFFSFSSDIDHVEICRDSEQNKIAFVTFKDAKALEIALLLSKDGIQTRHEEEIWTEVAKYLDGKS